MSGSFGVVKGARKWRVIEFVGRRSIAGVMVDEYRYASDPTSLQGEAIAALRRISAAKPARLFDPIADD